MNGILGGVVIFFAVVLVAVFAISMVVMLACIAYSCFCESFDLDPTHPIKAWRRGL